MPNDLPPLKVDSQQIRRWFEALCFANVVEDLFILLRKFTGRNVYLTATILDRQTLQRTPEPGACGGYDGSKRRKRSKAHTAVDRLGV